MKVNLNLIQGPSYIGDPKSYTVMYISKKIGNLIENLTNVEGSLIFAEKGIVVSKKIESKNEIRFSHNPQRDYAVFIRNFALKKQDYNKKRKYQLTEGGYYIGQNVIIGENCYIEPGCLIGHDVIIGRNAYIMSGAKIKNAVIGDDLIVNENAVIGSNGFTMTEDEQGNKLRIPTLGKVIIGNCVEIGAHDNISVGTAGNTEIDDFVKIDCLVCIEHDAKIGKNVEIVSGTVIGGYDVIGDCVFIGINASLKNRIVVGKQSVIGMGAIILNNVEERQTMIGNPGHVLSNRR